MEYQGVTTRMIWALMALICSIIDTDRVFAQEKQEKTARQEDAALKIETDLVTVPVIVTGRNGRFVTGLTRSDFEVREDGVFQKLDYFSSIEEPFNVALLIDTSRSTANKLNTIRKAAMAFIKQLQSMDRVMIVTFDEQVRFVTPLTNDQEELERSIEPLTNGYQTSLYDAISLTLSEKLNRVPGRKAIVVLTDGVDTASKQATFESTLELAGSSGVICYTIQYETHNDGASPRKPLFFPKKSSFTSNFQGGIPAPQTQGAEPGSRPSTRINSGKPQPLRDRNLIATDFLRGLAVQSGALYLRAENIENTSTAFRRIAEELRNQYTLVYTPTNDRRDGKYRRIGVKVSRDDLILRARPGYRIPKSEEKQRTNGK
jgi:Ca-activated chloride channel homolog